MIKRTHCRALILATAVAGCKGGAAAGDAATPQAVVGVQTAVATKGPFTETLGAIGTVIPRPGHVAALAAPQPARITHVYVTSGQHVRQGQVIGVSDCTGHCLGPHVHFEVRINGQPVDPMGYL